MSLISDLYPPTERASAVGTYYAVGMVGLVLSFLGGGYLSAQYGWRTAFLVAGVVGLCLTAIMLMFFREPPRAQFDVAPTTANSSAGHSPMLLLGRNAKYVWLVTAAAIGAFASLGVLQWLSLFFIRSHGLSLMKVGLLFGPAMTCGMIVGVFGGGWVGNRLARKSAASPLTFCVLVNLAVAPLYWLVLWLPQLEIALAVTFIAAALSTSWGPIFSATMQNVCDPSVRGLAAGVSNIGTALIGQALLPLVVGILSDSLAPSHGQEALRYALTATVTINLLSGLCFLRVRQLVARTSTAR